MAREASGQNVGGWLLTAVGLAVGGAAYVTGAQLLGQLFVEVFGENGRLLPDIGMGLIGFVGSAVAMTFIAQFVVRTFGQRGGRRWAIAGLWFVLYTLMGLFALVAKGVTLPVFVASLVGFGLLAGALVTPPLSRQQQRAKPARLGARRTATTPVVDSRQFGRVPAATVLLLTQHVRHARGPILAVLPSAPRPISDFTLGAVLDRTVQDWWQHGNTNGLGDQDIDDLKSFVALAATLATSGGQSLQTVEGQAVYRATLRALLDDWLANWNSDGQDGPPARY